MNNKLMQIFAYFGESEQKLQIVKEFVEFKIAFKDWYKEPTKENLMELVDEMNDMNIMISQFALDKGISCQEIESMKYNKVGRTLEIISKIESEGRTYEEIRKEY